ncbi:TROVE domain-containing protein [Glycomyces sp. A-F 0318]|uniref:TROVE domain-containing protein n=1 Tax=Glycomyces amatae TaxID=2881355 RepID=UPI001E4ED3FF|nr:TROVE domain-containing protein [Glycomyces amatae]MCD0446324.1 TROVE domain-containing protein [Glycomyces amatae]
MAKFNKQATRAAVTSPVRTEQVPTRATFEGGPGFARDAKSELFLLAVANMVSEATFYEAAGSRDTRFAELVRTVALADREWIARFIPWLRTEANMRSASLVAAAETAHALIANPEAYQEQRLAFDNEYGFGATVEPATPRQIVAAALGRADEPGEFLAYWHTRFGRNEPKAVKRGITDAVRRLYTEYAALKYDTDSKPYRFADVLNRVHTLPGDQDQDDLFAFLQDRRFENDVPPPASLAMVAANRELRVDAAGDPRALLDADRLRSAGFTWEDALSLAGDRVDQARLWEALMPSMGYMAAIRNLRAMDEASVTDAAAAKLAQRIADPWEVRQSRQFPYRFLSAYLAAPSDRWKHALEQALDTACENIPALPGRTLVLVDTSASMKQQLSNRSQVTAVQAAALFGVALAHRGANVNLVGFADRTFRHDIRKDGSVLTEVHRFCKRVGDVGHGTRIAESMRAAFNGHDRVVLFSDMQTMDGFHDRSVDMAIPADVLVYAWNLAGYANAAMPTGTGNRHEFGGFSDAAFRLISLLEAGKNANWPF